MDFNSFHRIAESRKKSFEPEFRSAKRLEILGFSIFILSTIPVLLLIVRDVRSGLTEIPFSTIAASHLTLIGLIIHYKLQERFENLQTKQSRLSKAHSDIEKLRLLIQGRAHFVLYLRDFSTGRHRQKKVSIPGGGISGIANPAMWPKHFGSETADAVISCIERYLPVVFLDNEDDRTPIESGITVYSEDETWESTFETLANCARYIVVDTRHTYSEGIQKELYYVSRFTIKKVILIGPGEVLSNLTVNYPNLDSVTVLTCPVPDEVETGREPFSVAALYIF